MKRRLLRVTAFSILIATMLVDIAVAGSCPDGPAMQQWRQQRQALLRTANIYRRAGIGTKFIPAYNRLERFTATFPSVFLEQEIRNFPLFNNVACLVFAMSKASGKSLRYGLVSNGTYDLFVDGEAIRQGLSASQLLEIAKSLR